MIEIGGGFIFVSKGVLVSLHEISREFSSFSLRRLSDPYPGPVLHFF